MAKTRMAEKLARTCVLLAGLRDPQVAPQLAHLGLTNDDIEEGWRLFHAAQRLHTGARPRPRVPAVQDAFEVYARRWFPTVRLALAHRFPAVAGELFEDLGRARGRSALWKVPLFVERIGMMERGERPYGGEGVAARAYLARRGLDDAALAEGRRLRARVERFESCDEEPEDADSVDVRRAHEAMWRWYLEWSGYARTALDRDLCRRVLGLGRNGRRASAADLESLAEAPK